MSSEIIKTLDGCINKVITIKLRNKMTIQGNLQSFDQGMNLVLIDSTDMSNKNVVAHLNKILIRGDNIMTLSLPNKFNLLTTKDDDASI